MTERGCHYLSVCEACVRRMHGWYLTTYMLDEWLTVEWTATHWTVRKSPILSATDHARWGKFSDGWKNRGKREKANSVKYFTTLNIRTLKFRPKFWKLGQRGSFTKFLNVATYLEGKTPHVFLFIASSESLV